MDLKKAKHMIGLKFLLMNNKKNLKSYFKAFNIKDLSDFLKRKGIIKKKLSYSEHLFDDLESNINYINKIKKSIRDLNFYFDETFYTTLICKDIIKKYNFEIDVNEKVYMIRKIKSNNENIIALVLVSNKEIKDTWINDDYKDNEELKNYIIYKIRYLNVVG